MIVWSISTQAGKYSPERCWFICFLNDLKFWYIISYKCSLCILFIRHTVCLFFWHNGLVLRSNHSIKALTIKDGLSIIQ